MQKISPAQKDKFVYVRLQDSANEFNVEFVAKLNTFIKNLKDKLKMKNEIQQIIDDCYVRQLDCT